MKALLCKEYGPPEKLCIEEHDDPLPRDGEVLVDIKAAGINFPDVLMIGGNIPGETQVLSTALYERVETLQYASAHWMAGGLMVFSLLLLSFIYRLNKTSPFNPAGRSQL